MKVSATELKNRTSEVIDAARNKPVQIERNGKPIAVLIGIEEFARLSRADDAVWGAAAMQAEESGYLSPEESFAQLRSMIEGATPKLRPRSAKVSR